MMTLPGSITVPQGFSASGVACGLKKNGQPDLALVVSDRPAVAAGVFTANKVKGHSLQLTQKNITGGLARAVVINSGNANACVGEPGLADALQMANAVAGHLACPPEQVMTGSTGVIGKRLDMAAVQTGIDLAITALSSDPEGGHLAEAAIMTTDTIPKEAMVRLSVGGKDVVVAGMAKGSGMIHPNMATMIGLLTTDCAIGAEHLYRLLRHAVDRSFNRVSVDGDTSVCDMVLVLANGAAGNDPVQPDSADDAKLQQAFDLVCEHLAKKVASDGEGATKLIEIRVDGALSSDDAYKMVQAVARSPLVKTAIFGEDANWGRILTAVGYSGAEFDPAHCDIYLGDLKVCQAGTALLFDEDIAKQILQKSDILIRIVLDEGDAADRIWTCDLTYDYVKINGSYRT